MKLQNKLKKLLGAKQSKFSVTSKTSRLFNSIFALASINKKVDNFFLTLSPGFHEDLKEPQSHFGGQ